MRVRPWFLAVSLMAGCLAGPAAADPPQLLVQNGHFGWVTAVASSSDGRHVFTGGRDGTFKVWDAQTQRVQSTCAVPDKPGNGRGVTTLSLSANGRLLAVATWSSVTLWDVSNPILPTRVADLQPSKEPIEFGYDPIYVEFSHGDLITGVGNEIRLWHLEGTQPTLQKTLPGNAQNGLAVSPDGQLVATGDANNLTLDNVANGQSAQVANPSQVYTASSADNKQLAGRPVTFGADNSVAASGGTIQVWDSSGKLKYRVDKNARFLASSPDGHRLASATFDGVIDILDSTNGSVQKEFQYNKLQPTSMAFEADSEHVVLGYEDGTARVFDMSGTVVSEFSGHSVPFRSVAFLPNGQGLITSTQSEVVVWNLTSGRIRLAIPRGPSESGAIAVAPDGRQVAIGDDTGLVQIVDLATGSVVRKLGPPGHGFRLHIESLAYSADGNRLAAGNASGYISVFDAASGDLVNTFQPQDEFAVSALAFGPDNRTLVSGHLAGEVRQQDLPTKTSYLRRPIEEHYKQVNDVALSPDGKTVVAAIDGGFVFTWPVDREAAPHILTLPGHPSPEGLSFSRQGRLAIALEGGQVLGWDLQAPQPTTLLEHAYNGTGQASFSPDGAILVTAGSDAAIRFWPAQGAAHPLAEAVQMDGGRDWVVTDARGRFDGSSGGQRLMEWRIGDKIYALEQFFNNYYTPGLLSQVLKPAPASKGSVTNLAPSMALGGAARSYSAAAPVRDISQLPAPPRVAILSPEAGDKVAAAEVVVKGRITDEGGGSSQVRLFLNGHRLPDQAVQGDSVTFHVRLVSGVNHLHLTAFNRDGSIESRGDDINLACTATAARPVLYVLAIGIDHYQSGLSLNCARNDAQSIAHFFKPGLFSAVKSTLLTDAQASKSDILRALDQLAAQTSPGDAVVIYLAGHGTLVGDVFYYLPYDVRKNSQDDIRATGLSSVELGEALTRIPATKQVLVLDACHSGAAAGSLGKLLASRDASSETLAVARLAHASGSYLIAASKESQTAKEIPALKHGVLTYAILHGLGEDGTPAAHENRDGQVTMVALLQYLDDAVPALTEKYQGGDTQDIVQASTGQDFPIVATGPR